MKETQSINSKLDDSDYQVNSNTVPKKRKLR